MKTSDRIKVELPISINSILCNLQIMKIWFKSNADYQKTVIKKGGTSPVVQW